MIDPNIGRESHSDVRQLQEAQPHLGVFTCKLEYQYQYHQIQSPNDLYVYLYVCGAVIPVDSAYGLQTLRLVGTDSKRGEESQRGSMSSLCKSKSLTQ